MGPSIILYLIHKEENKMKWNSHANREGRLARHHPSLSGGRSPSWKVMLVKNIFAMDMHFYIVQKYRPS